MPVIARSSHLLLQVSVGVLNMDLVNYMKLMVGILGIQEAPELEPELCVHFSGF